jgi:hypothetical protein
MLRVKGAPRAHRPRVAAVTLRVLLWKTIVTCADLARRAVGRRP